MKKSEIEEIEKIKQQEKLPDSTKQEIKKIVFNNLINAITILVLLIVLMLIPKIVKNELVVIIYKTTSVLTMLFSLFLFEKSYRKDDLVFAVSGIEILTLSILILFTPYGFLVAKNIFLQLSGVYYVIYYIIKSIIIYITTKNKYQERVSDIHEIVKKESKDKINELNQIKQEKARQEKIKQEKANKEKIKPEKARKDKTKQEKTKQEIVRKQKTANNNSQEKSSNVETASSPRKRGRPRKEQVSK